MTERNVPLALTPPGCGGVRASACRSAKPAYQNSMIPWITLVKMAMSKVPSATTTAQR
jgi:hypothetical protein